MTFCFFKPKEKLIENDLEVPIKWLPPAAAKRIHVHWTAGSYIASSLDKEHYHFLIEFRKGTPRIVRGQHSIRSNLPPLREGRYAAHTYRANSNAIGIAICGMNGANDRPFHAGNYPIKKKQWELAVKLIARLADQYAIDVTPTTILTHAEVTGNLNIRQRGKWDIAVLPFWKKNTSPRDVGDKLRAEVGQYVRKTK